MAPGISSVRSSYVRSLRASMIRGGWDRLCRSLTSLMEMYSEPVWVWPSRTSGSSCTRAPEAVPSSGTSNFGPGIGRVGISRACGFLHNRLGESPCKTTENKTTRQHIGTRLSLPGTPAMTGNKTSNSELKARGPNHAMRNRSFQRRFVGSKAGMNATGRAKNTPAVNRSVPGPMMASPVQMSECPNSTNANIRAISAVVSPYSRKQSHNSTSSAEFLHRVWGAGKTLWGQEVWGFRREPGEKSGSRSWGVEPGQRALVLHTAIQTENRAQVAGSGPATATLHRRHTTNGR